MPASLWLVLLALGRTPSAACWREHFGHAQTVRESRWRACGVRKLDPCDVQDVRVAQFGGETELASSHTLCRFPPATNHKSHNWWTENGVPVTPPKVDVVAHRRNTASAIWAGSIDKREYL